MKRWLRTLFPAARSTPSQSRLSLTQLEERATPALHVFVGSPGDPRWSVAKNWNTGVVPQTGEPGGTFVQFNLPTLTSITVRNDVPNLTVDSFSFNQNGTTNYIITLDEDLKINSAFNGVLGSPPPGIATLNTTGGTFTFNGTKSLVAVTADLDLNISAGNKLNLAVPITGTVGLRQLGTGTVTLDGANTFTGGTTVNAGTLRLIGNQAQNRLPAKSTVSVNSGGTLEFANTNTTPTVEKSVNLVLNGGTFQLGGGAVNEHAHLGNVIFNDGGRIKTNGPIGSFADTNLFINGKLSVTGKADPSIDLPNGLGFGPNSTIDVADQRTLTLSKTTGVYNFDFGTTNSLIKDGKGTLVIDGPVNLSQNNGSANTGNFTAKAGTLIFNGTVANGAAATDVVVTGTGIVGGKGTIAGAVQVQAGGALLPGTPTTVATLSTGSVTFQTGGFFGVKINGSKAGEFDALKVTGKVDLGKATLFVADKVAVSGGPIVVIDNDGDGKSDPITTLFQDIPEGGVVAGKNGAYAVSYKGGDGNDVTLTPIVPQTFLVDNNATDTADGKFGPGELTLREAITLANATLSADTITFDAKLSGQTITLNGNELPTINNSLTIIGPAGGLTIDGNNKSRVFTIDDGNPSLSTVNLSNLTFTNAQAADGGAIDIFEDVNITGSTFFGNTATASGGAFAVNKGTTTLVNSTVSGNKALANGGGINARESGKLVVMNSTIVRNIADSDGNSDGISGGISNFSSKEAVTLTNTIVAGNTRGKDGATSDDLSTEVSNASTNNIIGDAKSAGGLTNNFDNATNTGNFVGVALGSVVSPTLANNGGPTMTHAIVPGTFLAVGTGTKAGFMSTDQRGFVRPVAKGFNSDIGSYQLQLVSLTPGPDPLVPQPPVTVLPGGTQGTAYSQQLAAGFPNQPTGTTYAFTTPDPLPVGLTLSPTGLISGTPTTIGTTTLSIVATSTNTGDFSVPVTYSITVTSSAPASPTDTDAANNGVAEGAANGTPVGLTITSPGASGVILSLSDDAGGRFAINPSTGVVTVANGTLLNFETAATHTVTAMATNAIGSSTANFTIVIGNVNPSTPIDADAAANTVAVGAANGTAVGLTASATDPNGPAVIYSLTDDANGRFAINPTSGVVTVAKSSAITTAGNVNVTVRASDGQGGTTNTVFTIVVNSTVPAGPYLVDNTATDTDDGKYGKGQLTLREAVNLANLNAGPDAISFAPGLGTIALTAGELMLTDPAATTITGPTTVTRSGATAFRIFNIAANATATINALTITNGQAANGGGLLNSGTLTINTSTFTGKNTATMFGGGLFNAGTLTVTSSTFDSNNAGVDGGGIANAGTVTLTNVTISGNTAVATGGGLDNIGTTVGKNLTVFGNTAAGGGGGLVTTGGTVTITNSIVAGNLKGTAPNDIQSTVAAGSTNNIIGDPATAGGLTFDFAGNFPNFTGNFVGDDLNPGKLLPIASILNTKLANNGGPTQTHALVPRANHPAIGTGTKSGITTSDQRGFLRPVDPMFNPDIGSYELQLVRLTPGPDPTTPNPAPTVLPGATVGVAYSQPITASFPNQPSGNYAYTATGLPAGLSINPASGLISGTPTAVSTATINITATNTNTGDFLVTPVVYTLTISAVNPANQPPVANADTATALTATAKSINVLSNDTDPDTKLLTIATVGPPANGTATITGDTVTYTSKAGFVGTDTFTYTVSDGKGGTSAPAVVTVTVTASGTSPSVNLVGFREFGVGTDFGGSSAILFNPDGSPRFSVTPFGSFTGGIRTATADFNRDGVADLVVGTGPGRATRVLILDGKTQGELFAVDPFEAAFTGGVYVAAGDVNGDGIPDLAITPDEGGGPRADVFSGAVGFPKIASFFGIEDTNFRGGARASIADMTGDGAADLIVVAGFGGGPRVAGFDGRSLNSTPRKIFNDFFAFELALRNGIFVTTGDLNGDGKADLIAGGGPGGGPRVLAFDGANLVNNQTVNLANFFGGNADNRGGVRLTVKDLDGDNRADILVGAGAGAGSKVTSYLGRNILPNGTPTAQLDFDSFAGFAGGVFVG